MSFKVCVIRRLVLSIAAVGLLSASPAIAEDNGEGKGCNGIFAGWVKSHPKVIANLTARKEALEERGLPPAIDRKIGKVTAMVSKLNECQAASDAGGELPGHCKKRWADKLVKLTAKIAKLEQKKESVAARFAKKIERMAAKIEKFQKQLATAQAACSQ